MQVLNYVWESALVFCLFFVYFAHYQDDNMLFSGLSVAEIVTQCRQNDDTGISILGVL